MSNKELYDNIFAKVFSVDKELLGEEFVFGSVPNWDSVAHLNLITELEDTFGVMLETEDILHYGSYLNGIEILRKSGVEF
ncbi:MAG: acyl carrier protein [Eubacteriales bacterium]|nr:acyl carrier protein [Eubacteriales bacterium]